MNYNMLEEARELAGWSKESEALSIYQALERVGISERFATLLGLTAVGHSPDFHFWLQARRARRAR